MNFLGRVRVQFGLVIIAVFNLLINIAPGSRVRTAFLRLFRCDIGRGVGVHSWIRFTWPGRLRVGDDSTINFGCFIDSRGGINIGEHVMIGHRCSIYTATHDLDSGEFELVKRSVKIDDYVVIFPHSLIMPGVCIGRGAVILPGSVVTANVNSFDVVGGVPAKFVRRRAKNLGYKLSYQYLFINS